ncbi:tRNA (mnm(5)s(2)U34)-methyltransferase [Desulfoscipio gibsoniae]|uniref:Putative S-adenosylmethionine-dependent methyltransferase involved in cell envelope biogenesis n=1 Tax=Desulfoscipio gibsoniae DSM 7213 TaxID=767817 RepID=R4KHD9_9FIRM|nr:class I SAM-dependent methyltransferase [Desulfoscipio gibsoniae]AGL02004.1 putative S-adenosylmethionine-dependent methyltransferase involved in cell envelope biogenesis [Desulfoscipio gibsoniae DSM 7213]
MYHKRPVNFAGIRGNAVLLGQRFVGEVLHKGSVAVDATAGNGYDTLFLANSVGECGRVYAFDIQQSALDITARRLKQFGLEKNVTLIHDGHEKMDLYIVPPVDAFIFNLGYLPGGDHDKITRPSTTVKALQIALDMLNPGGRISIVVYTGHLGAGEESRTVEEMAAKLDPRIFGVLKVTFINRSASAPFLIFIERVKKENENLAP